MRQRRFIQSDQLGGGTGAKQAGRARIFPISGFWPSAYRPSSPSRFLPNTGRYGPSASRSEDYHGPTRSSRSLASFGTRRMTRLSRAVETFNNEAASRISPRARKTAVMHSSTSRGSVSGRDSHGKKEGVQTPQVNIYALPFDPVIQRTTFLARCDKPRALFPAS